MLSSFLACILAPFVQAPTACTPAWIPTFGGEPGFEGAPDVFATFDDGTGPALYAGGGFTSANGHSLANIAKWDGATWSPVGGGVDWNVTSLCVFDDGSGSALYVGGWFSNAGGVPASRIARWDGHTWSPLNAGLDGAVNTLVGFDDGTGPALYVGGEFTHADGIAADHVAKWNGSSWSALGAGLGSTTLGNKQVYALTIFDDGNGPALYAGGRITHTGTTPISIISKWNGTVWQSVGNQFFEGGGSFDAIFDMLVFDDGSGPALYVCGDFQTPGMTPIRDFARWNGSVWTTVGGGIQGWNVSRLMSFDFGNGPELIVSGDFWNAGGTALADVVRWNGSAWSSMPAGAPPFPSSFASWGLGQFDDGTGPALFLTGNFEIAGGMPAKHIARWKGTWSGLGTGVIDHPTATAVLDDGHGPKLYAAFHNDGNGPAVDRVARWTGSSWMTMGAPFGSWVQLLTQFDSGSGPEIYAAGPTGIARWNGSAWIPIGGSFGHLVEALAVFDAGTGPALYAGGAFTVSNGAPGNYLVSWNGSSWSAVLPALDGEVSGLATLDFGAGPRLFAGGTFLTAGTTSAAHIASFDGTSWSGFGSGLSYPGFPASYGGATSIVKADLGTGPSLFVAGGFLAAGGTSASNIAEWDGSQWLPLGTGLDNAVQHMLVFDDGSGPALFAIGQFATAGGIPVEHVARWDGSNWFALDLPNTGLGDGTVFDAGDGLGATLVLGGTFDVSPAADSQIARFGGCSAAFGTPFCFGDGSGTACPCGNAVPAGVEAGCLHSLGMGARLTTTGSASVTHDTLVLLGSQMPDSSALYFQGTTRVLGGLGAPFGDGLRCAGGTMTRLGAKANSGGTSHYPIGADASISVRGMDAAGDVRTYQVWYRNAAAFCTSATFNLTNGVEVTWHP